MTMVDGAKLKGGALAVLPGAEVSGEATAAREPAAGGPAPSGSVP